MRCILFPFARLPFLGLKSLRCKEQQQQLAGATNKMLNMTTSSYLIWINIYLNAWNVRSCTHSKDFRIVHISHCLGMPSYHSIFFQATHDWWRCFCISARAHTFLHTQLLGVPKMQPCVHSQNVYLFNELMRIYERREEEYFAQADTATIASTHFI